MHAFLLFVALSPVASDDVASALRDIEYAIDRHRWAVQMSLDDIAHYQFIQALRAGPVGPRKPRIPERACSKSGQGPLMPCQRYANLNLGQWRRASMMWRQYYLSKHDMTSEEFADACLAQWQAQEAQAAAE